MYVVRRYLVSSQGKGEEFQSAMSVSSEFIFDTSAVFALEDSSVFELIALIQ